MCDSFSSELSCWVYWLSVFLAQPFWPSLSGPKTFFWPIPNCLKRLSGQCFIIFPPVSWSVYNQYVKSNNAHEGWHNKLKNAADRKVRLNLYRLVELLFDEAKEVPLTAALLCQNLLRQHSSAGTEATNDALFSLWRAYEDRDISTKDLLGKGSAVMANAFAARLNKNIRQVCLTLFRII